MSVNEETQTKSEENTNQDVQVNKPDALDEFFSEREQERSGKTEETPVEPSNKTVEKEKTANKEKSSNENESDKQKSKAEVSKDKEESTEIEELRKKAEKLDASEKSLSTTQKWANSINRKLKAAQREIQRSFDNGDLTEEQAKSLNNLLQSDNQDEEETPSDDNPLSKLISIAQTRMDDLREVFESDKHFDSKADAFDFFIRNSSDDDLKIAMDELAELEKHPFKLAKKMYSIGEECLDCYKDIQNAGGVIKYYELSKKNEEKLKKDIDKLNEKLAKSEDHDKPTHRIDELGGNVSQEKPKSGDLIDEMISERDRVMRRR